MLDQLFANKLYPTGLEFRRYAGYPNTEGAILIVPGRYWVKVMHDIEDAVASYKWLLLIRTGDEEDLFDVDQFAAPPNTQFWIQTPRRDYPDARLFGVGASPHMQILPAVPPTKNLDVFISAQDTHRRRRDCFNSLDGLDNSRVHRTAGFTQGMDPAEYVACCAAAKIMPCPSGAVSPDSFRVWEALEAGALPVVDSVSPVDGVTDYWSRLFGEVPFPVVTDWDGVDWAAMLEEWPANANRVQAWWTQMKRRYVDWLREDLETLGAV